MKNDIKYCLKKIVKIKIETEKQKQKKRKNLKTRNDVSRHS